MRTGLSASQQVALPCCCDAPLSCRGGHAGFFVRGFPVGPHTIFRGTSGSRISSSRGKYRRQACQKRGVFFGRVWGKITKEESGGAGTAFGWRMNNKQSKNTPKAGDVVWVACRGAGERCEGTQAKIVFIRPLPAGGRVFRYVCLTCNHPFHVSV